MSSNESNWAVQRRMYGEAKSNELVFLVMEKRLVAALGPHSRWSDSVFNHSAVIDHAGVVLGGDCDAHCNAVNARGRMASFEAALYRHSTGCCAGRANGELF